MSETAIQSQPDQNQRNSGSALNSEDARKSNMRSSQNGSKQQQQQAPNSRPQSSARSKKVVISDRRRSKGASPQDSKMSGTVKEGTLGATGKSQEGGNGQEGGATMNATSESKNLLGKRKIKPAYLQSLNESEKQENFKIIDSMNKKISYLKNPRHKVNKAPILMTTAIKDSGEADKIQKETSFRIEPTAVNFQDYQVNGVYEIAVKVTNTASVSKRIKFIPPATDMFTLHRIKFPSGETGDVAPGMSLTFAVVFCAPSFADFDDFVTFVTEENSFKLPLKARREPPVINLVNPMDCLNSWLGDRVDMAFRCVNAGGDGGFKFFCDKDEDDLKQTDVDSIKIGSFTLNPSEFYLYAGNAIDIYVTFQPEREGYLEEKLILACDNQTSEYYKVNGNGAMLDLDIESVDGKVVDFKANPLETMYFENTNPTSESRRTIKIKNSSPIPVHYHWSVYRQKGSKQISLADEETHYRIEPEQGKIGGKESIEFSVFFRPQHAEPYFEFCDLIVEDIPISAVRNPPEGLKNFAAANKVQSKVPMPTYVGSNTQFLSIPIIQFNLRGQGNSCQVEVTPPITIFEGDTFIGEQYSKTVQLKKLTAGVVKYKLRMEGKNRETFSCQLQLQGKTIRLENEILEGELAVDSVDMQLTVESEERGKGLAYFFLEIEDGPPVSFSCQATFRGPILKLGHPVIDFGLSKVNTQKTAKLTIQNESPIPAPFMIKSAKNKKLTWDNHITLEESQQRQSEQTEGKSSTAGIVVGKPVKTRRGNTMSFDVSYGTLRPNQTITVELLSECVNQESFEEYFEVMVRGAEPQYFQVIGEVQQPKVYLNRDTIELGKIYAGIRETIEHGEGKYRTQYVELVNYGNLPVRFNWEEVNDPSRVIARFEPQKGVIQPKQRQKIAFQFTVFIGGAIDELMMCDVEDLELPLGFEVKADAFGLNVAYMTNEEQHVASAASLSSNQKEMLEQAPELYAEMNRLQMISFTNCSINKPESQTFILKNLSGISTKFLFGAQTFEPINHVAPQQKSEIQIAMEAEQARIKAEMEASMSQNAGRSFTNAGKQLRFASSVKSQNSKAFAKRRVQPILSDEHEHTQKFTSVTGNSFTKEKALEKEMQFYLSNNKGIALVFSPHEGELAPNSEIPIKVTIYNNVCGKFDDVINANVKGLPQKNFPVRIAISGSPMIIPPNQVGLNYNTIPVSLPMPTVVANSAAIQKTFRIKNTGIRQLTVNWSVIDQKDLERPNTDIFALNLSKNTSFDKKKFPYKFNWKALEPEETKGSAFEVQPKIATVASRSVQEFKVTFTPTPDSGRFQSILLSSPEISKEEVEQAQDPADLPKKGTLGVIALKLDANSIRPQLDIDKSTKMDGGKHIRVRKWAVADENAPSNVAKLTFSNNSKADMVFNFGVDGPFEIVKSKTNSGGKHPLADQEKAKKVVKKKVETMFCLQPLKIVELHVKFMAPKAADTAEWPMIMNNERSGKLIASFQNGDTQKFSLHGLMLRPKIILLTEYYSRNDKGQDELDFKTCNVDRHRTIRVYLSNITEVTANWSLNYVKFPKKTVVSKYTTTVWEEENLQKQDDPNVFEFSLTSGSLRGKSLPLRKVPEGLYVPPVPKDELEKQYIPQTILINFRPKLNCLYKSKFRFTCDNGLSCDIILKGKGSYEENHD